MGRVRIEITDESAAAICILSQQLRKRQLAYQLRTFRLSENSRSSVTVPSLCPAKLMIIAGAETLTPARSSENRIRALHKDCSATEHLFKFGTPDRSSRGQTLNAYPSTFRHLRRHTDWPAWCIYPRHEDTIANFKSADAVRGPLDDRGAPDSVGHRLRSCAERKEPQSSIAHQRDCRSDPAGSVNDTGRARSHKCLCRNCVRFPTGRT
jgi:hypothetical protein